MLDSFDDISCEEFYDDPYEYYDINDACSFDNEDDWSEEF